MIAFVPPFMLRAGSVSSTTSYDQIVRDQLIDAITTNQGERVMNPEWGCNIQAVLYDPSSALERFDTAAYIRDRLIHMVPRALIKSVSVDVSDAEPNVVYIDILYKASSYAPESSLSMNIELTGGTS